MAGRIATFIETLHLTYDEILNRIPYRLLLLMQRDKQHVATGSVVKRTTGKDMAARRRRNNKQQ